MQVQMCKVAAFRKVSILVVMLSTWHNISLDKITGTRERSAKYFAAVCDCSRHVGGLNRAR
jgi:hypothetical protein